MQFKDSVRFLDTLNIKTIKDISENKGGVTKTRIIIRDHDTQEIIAEGENKILVPGSQSTVCNQFGVGDVVFLPTYNTEMELENSHPPYPQTVPLNTPITCLWCAGRSGAGSAPNEVYAVSNTDRISPDKDDVTDPDTGITYNVYKDILPFRYVSADNDLDADEREMYFGRKPGLINKDGEERIGYFFKAFETIPQLHVRYLDGTEVTSDMYDVESSQAVEVYVELKLSITRKDFRDYFNEVLGWGSADVSTISLVTAWFDDTITPEGYRWYQDILPFSKFNFISQPLNELTKAIDFTYQVYY